MRRTRLACWTALVASIAALNYYARFTSSPSPSPSAGRDDVYSWSAFAGGLVVYGLWLGLVLAIAIDRTDLLALRRPRSLSRDRLELTSMWENPQAAGTAIDSL